MDPDRSAQFSSSMLFKASLLTLTFTSIYFYRTQKKHSVFKPAPLKTATAAVKEAPKLPVKKKKKKTIYFTFDDGPDKGSKNVISIMDQEQVPATMFVIGEHVYGSREQKDIWETLSSDSLFEIANHSYTHAFENKYNQFYSNADSAVKDFQRCADSLKLSDNIIRTPGRNIWRTENISSTDLKNSIATADSLRSKGFTAVGWDLEWHFTSDRRLVQSDSLLANQIDSLFAKQKTKTAGHLVLLAHDRTFLKSDDSAALHRLIKELKKKNEYDFEQVSKYPGTGKE